VAVAGSFRHHRVELRVELRQFLAPILLDRRPRHFGQLVEPGDEFGGAPPHRQSRHLRLKRRGHLEDLAALLWRQPGHRGAAARRNAHKAFGLQRPQRLADGVARDPELLGEERLDQPLALGEPPRQDRLTDLVGDDLPERAMVLPDPSDRALIHLSVSRS
jgi:hypothetical protein